MNDLVVEASTPSLKACAEGLRLIGPGIVVADGIDRSNGLVIAAGAASGLTDAAELVLDPIASMAASAASFLMEYVEPLREALDSLAGNPSAVGAQAQTWSAIAERVVESAEAYTLRTSTALTGWEGPAATGYRTFVASYTSILSGVGTICAGISSAMVGASAIVGFVRTIVRETIADLVGKLISWAAEVLLTAGAGATWVVPKAARTIAQYVNKVQQWISDLTRTIRDLSTTIKTLNGSLDSVVPVVARIRQNMDVPLVPQVMRPSGRPLPNLNDLVPSGFTTMTNSTNSGVNAGIAASEEPA